ncbi:MAG: Slx4p interacting protein [Candelina submexicana]|nr:MAG: Slx4p interacting protein [Candelina submexicana]
MSLTDKLSNLHLLLRVHSFARWPLEVRFFSEDVYNVWKRWAERVDSRIRNGIKISLDLKQVSSTEPELLDGTPGSSQARSKARVTTGKEGLEGVSVSYDPLKDSVEKGLFMLADGESVDCGVCKVSMGRDPSSALLCPERGCRMVSHLTCLSKTFLAQEENEGAIVPTEGRCPGCNARQKWVDLVKERSLRTRGKREVEKLMKKPREKKTKAVKGNKHVSTTFTAEDQKVEEDGENDNENDDTEPEVSDIEEQDDTGGLSARDMADAMNDDDWYYREDESDDNISVVSETSDSSMQSSLHSPKRLRKQQGKKLEIVIEDSDWEDALVLD